jgi:Integrase core domain/HTH-like domain
VSRYRCVDAQKAAGFPVAAACEAAGVSRSAFYAWVAGAQLRPSPAERQEATLVAEIRTIHRQSSQSYGSPRVHAELRRRGWKVNHKRVERLMATHGIIGHRPRRRRSLTKADTAAAPAPDLLGRLFDPDRPDVAWCGDVTYIRTDEGWLYLASVLDLASRHLLGWSMGTHHDAGLVCDALQAAMATRGRDHMDGTIFHTDRGAEGRFNWLSQHLDPEVVRDGCGQATAEDQGDARPDVVAGSAVDRAACGSSPLLGGDRSRPIERGRRGAGRRVAGGRLEMVPAGWWDATDLLGPSVGPIPIVLRTRRHRDPARPAARGTCDRSPHRSFTIDDFARASPQRVDS